MEIVDSIPMTHGYSGCHCQMSPSGKQRDVARVARCRLSNSPRTRNMVKPGSMVEIVAVGINPVQRLSKALARDGNSSNTRCARRLAYTRDARLKMSTTSPDEVGDGTATEAFMAAGAGC